MNFGSILASLAIGTVLVAILGAAALYVGVNFAYWGSRAVAHFFGRK